MFLLVSPEYNQNFAGVEYEDLEEPEKDEQAIDFLIGKTFPSTYTLHLLTSTFLSSYFDHYEYIFYTI